MGKGKGSSGRNDDMNDDDNGILAFLSVDDIVTNEKGNGYGDDEISNTDDSESQYDDCVCRDSRKGKGKSKKGKGRHGKGAHGKGGHGKGSKMEYTQDSNIESEQHGSLSRVNRIFHLLENDDDQR